MSGAPRRLLAGALLCCVAGAALACKCAPWGTWPEGEPHETALLRNTADAVRAAELVVTARILERFATPPQPGYAYRLRIGRRLAGAQTGGEAVVHDDGLCLPAYRPGDTWTIFVRPGGIVTPCGADFRMDGGAAQAERTRALEKVTKR